MACSKVVFVMCCSIVVVTVALSFQGFFCMTAAAIIITAAVVPFSRKDLCVVVCYVHVVYMFICYGPFLKVGIGL